MDGYLAYKKRVEFLDKWAGRKKMEIDPILDQGFSEDQAIELLKILALESIEEAIAHSR